MEKVSCVYAGAGTEKNGFQLLVMPLIYLQLHPENMMPYAFLIWQTSHDNIFPG